MHHAYEVIPVLERLPLEIESLTAYDGNLVVGTRQGHLLMYNVGESGSMADVQLLRSNKKFSRKPITQVAVVPHHQILISLSDSIVSIHDLTVYNFPLLDTMDNTKGATTFDLEVKQHVSMTGETAVTVRLAVCVRRRLQLYYWKTRQFQPLQEELPLADVPLRMMWSGGALVMEHRDGYRRIQLSGEQGPLVEAGRGCETRVMRAGEEEVALQVANTSLVIMDGSGNCSQPQQLAWTATPTAIVHQAPFVVGVVGGKQVEVVSCQEKLLLQTLNLSKPRLLAPDVATNRGSAGLRRVFCASLSHVWCLSGLAPGAQIPNLLTCNQYGLALTLLDTWSRTGSVEEEGAAASTREHIRKLHAFHLFCCHQYQQALDTFLEIDTELLFVVGLFPALVPEDCQRRLQYPTPPPVLKPPNLQTALACLIDYLLKKRQRLVMAIDKSGGSGKGSREGTPLRGGRKKGALHHQLQVVDTTLLKCYLQERPGLVGPLLRIPDGCVSLVEGERLLRASDRLPDFLLLLRARGQHSRALALLHQHQHTTDPSPLKGPKALVDYLQNMGPEHLDLVLSQSAWLARHHPLELLRVFTGSGAAITDAELLPRYRIVDYLKEQQPRLALLYLEHLIHEWNDVSPGLHNELIKQYRDVIVEETERHQRQQRPPPTTAAGSTLDGSSQNTNNLASRRLEGETEGSDVNNRGSSATNPATGDVLSPIEGIDSDSITKLNTVNSISSTTSINNSSSSGKPSAGSCIHPDLHMECGEVQRKLLSFLRSSSHYTPATVLLSLADHECLLPGRAVVLGVLGQHRQALQLYITALHDLPAALHYCHQYYTSTATGTASQVYLFLLELLVQCDDVATLLSPRQPVPPHAAPPTTTTTTTNSSSSTGDLPLASSNPCDSSNSSSSRTGAVSGSNGTNSGASERTRTMVASSVRSGTASGITGASAGPAPPPLIEDAAVLQESGRSSRASMGSSSNTDRPGSASSSAEGAKFDMLLNLLHTYARYIRLKPAVQLLPDSLAVCELRGFLQSWVRQFAADRRKTLLQRGVAQAVNSQVTSDLCAAQANKISLSTQRSCCICSKRLTRFSAFVCSPSGAVCHFSCRERLHSDWLQEVQQAHDKQALHARTRAAVAAATEAL